MRANGQPQPGELAHGGGRFAGHDLDHPRVGQEVAFPHGVGEVLLPGILGIARPQRRVDPAGGQHRVGVEAVALPDDSDLGASLSGGEGGAQPRSAGPDDQDVTDAASHGRLAYHDPVPQNNASDCR